MAETAQNQPLQITASTEAHHGRDREQREAPVDAKHSNRTIPERKGSGKKHLAATDAINEYGLKAFGAKLCSRVSHRASVQNKAASATDTRDSVRTHGRRVRGFEDEVVRGHVSDGAERALGAHLCREKKRKKQRWVLDWRRVRYCLCRWCLRPVYTVGAGGSGG